MAQTGRGKRGRTAGDISVAHKYEVGCEQAVDEHVRLHGCESSAVLSRNLHARIRRSESGRVAVTCCKEVLGGLSLSRQSVHFSTIRYRDI